MIMKNTIAQFFSAGMLLIASLASAQVEYVDPSMGGQGFMLEPTRSTVSLPNSMVRVYPVRKDQLDDHLQRLSLPNSMVRVYPVRKDQLDDQIHSFPLTIISHRLGELFWLMPGDGSPDAWNHPAVYDQEVETPYYYSTRFDASLIQTEFAPAAHCGYFRFTFPSNKPVVLLANRLEGSVSIGDNNSVSGVEKFNNMQAFFYGEFSAPVQVQASGNNRRLTISAHAGQKVLEFRYGISFISTGQARKNLQAEIPAWSFEKVKHAARERWKAMLGQTRVEGGTPEQKGVFYTSLYRCYERMVNITEDGQ